MASIENVMVPVERSRCLQIRYALVPDITSSCPTKPIHAINGTDIKCQHFISGMEMQSSYFFCYSSTSFLKYRLNKPILLSLKFFVSLLERRSQISLSVSKKIQME